MTAIKVLISNIIQEQWHAVEDKLINDPRFKCVGRVSKHIELLLAVRSTQADAVVVFAENYGAGILSHLFAEYPDLTVLMLCSSGEAFIVERCPSRRAVFDLSTMGVIEALRDAVTRSCDDFDKHHLH